MNWMILSENKPVSGLEILMYNAKWIDEDFNPNGTRIGFKSDVLGYVTAYWCNKHDEYLTRDSFENNTNFKNTKAEDQIPTHWCYITKPLKNNQNDKTTIS